MQETVIENGNLNRGGGKSNRGYTWIAVVTLLGTAAFVLIPVIVASWYTFYSHDDFTNVHSARALGSNLIISALKYTIQCYLTWQGTYTSIFLMIAISPLNGLGLMQLRAVMILNILLFNAALWIFVCAVCRSMHVEETRYSILFYSLCVIGIFAFTGWTEVFYWFVGSTVYAFPMTLCLLGLAMTLQAKSAKGNFVAGLLMFLASGGALQIAGVGCCVLLGICVIKWLDKSIKRKDYIIFGLAVLGALINTVAPGNYVRHDIIDDTGMHLGAAVIETGLEVLQTVETLLFNTPCILLILAAVVIGAVIGKTKKVQEIKVVWAVVLLCAVTPFVTCFPVLLGYSSTLDEFPNRCKFIETIVIVCGFMLIAAIAGCMMSERLYSLRKGELCAGVALFLIVMSSTNPAWRASQSVPGEMWNEIARGSYREYYEKVNEIYDMVEHDPNENVFIYEMPEEAPHFPILRLREDMSYWINAGCAGYFGKASVQTVSEPLYVQGNGQKNIRISPATFGGQTGYLSIYKLDEEGELTEIVQELQLLDSNILISMPPEDTGIIKWQFYEDSKGMVKIDEREFEY